MKQLITDYIFDVSEKIIEFKFAPKLEQILLITNVTDQIIIYNFADTSLGGTIYGNILTLEYDTTSMEDSDDLQVYIDIEEEKVYEDKNEILNGILTELKVISFLLNEGEEVDEIREHFQQ